jgi:hypothetical protein
MNTLVESRTILPCPCFGKVEFSDGPVQLTAIFNCFFFYVTLTWLLCFISKFFKVTAPVKTRLACGLIDFTGAPPNSLQRVVIPVFLALKIVVLTYTQK